MYDLVWYMELWAEQLEPIATESELEQIADMEEDLTHIFTIQEGEVVYCGKITAGTAYEDNAFFGELDYLPSYYIDVYQNEVGEFRYLSCEDCCHSSGYYQIYVSTFGGRSISDRPEFVIGYTYDEQGKIIYSYAKGKWLEENQEAYDDRMAFEQIIEEYMPGYKKADIEFVVSEYRVPAFAGELPEE